MSGLFSTGSLTPCHQHAIQSQILNLLNRLQQEFGISYLFITHDLRVVRHVSDRVGVLYLGTIMEEAPTDELFGSPLHPYTKALFCAVPRFDESGAKTLRIEGEIPSPFNPPSGCLFHTRCPECMERCKREVPEEIWIDDHHRVRCFLYER